MNGNWVPVLIVVAVMFMIVMKARYRHLGNQRSNESPEERAETLRLREEVAQLKERLKVLERITVEKENSLSKEIDALRDR
jgi:hypothetical protein